MPSLNLVDSSFEHVLHSYGLHLVSTYKYELSNWLFNSISYLLDNHLSSFEFRQNNTTHLNQCLLLHTKKVQQSCIWELNPSFLFDLHQGMVTNEHQYVTKMALNVNMGGLWGDFTTIFWITKYIQRPIYI
jgi:hypothetical protein